MVSPETSTLSVISSSRLELGRLYSSRSARSSSTSPGCISCTAEIFTAAVSVSPRSRKRHRSAQTCRSTQLPMLIIEPLVSASGMNSAGETGPKVGLVQRSSASSFATFRSPELRIGW
ncbi:hypothetical protein D3C73_1285460 [compost metagenome]